MIRDFLKEPDYYQQAFDDVSEELIEYIDEINSGNNDEDQVEVLIESLFDIHCKKITLSYTLGHGHSVLKASIEACLESFNTHNFGLESRYEFVLWFCSLYYCLDMDSPHFNAFISHIQTFGHNDKLMSSILSGIVDSYPVPNHINIDSPYKRLEGILSQKKNTSISQLKDYLDNSWYQGSSDSAWYGRHKRTKGFAYTGYWSFETAALVKLFHLDDSSLKACSYYPYDLNRLVPNSCY